MGNPKHIGGNGGVYIELPGIYGVEFPIEKAYAEVESEEVEESRTDLNGDEQEWSRGYRFRIPCQFYNIEETDFWMFKVLAQLIDVSKADRIPLRIYPKYNSETTGSVYYDCRCKGKWKLEDIFKSFECGQVMPELVFVSVGLRSELPQHVDTALPDTRVTPDGDTRVTPEDDTRVCYAGW